MKIKLRISTVTLLLMAANPAFAQDHEAASSGSVNVDCDSTAGSRLSIVFPSGTSFKYAYGSWTDLSNVKEAVVDPGQVSGNNMTFTGHIVGLDKQDVAFGIKNCPGGGHGTFKIFLSVNQ